MDQALKDYLFWKVNQWAMAQRQATGARNHPDVAALAKAYVRAHYMRPHRPDLVQEITRDVAVAWTGLCTALQTVSDDGVLTVVTDVLGLVDSEEVGAIGELVADALLLACGRRSRWMARNAGAVGVGAAAAAVLVGIGLLGRGGGQSA